MLRNTALFAHNETECVTRYECAMNVCMCFKRAKFFFIYRYFGHFCDCRNCFYNGIGRGGRSHYFRNFSSGYFESARLFFFSTSTYPMTNPQRTIAP